ncbi:CCHC-type integrase [Hibiscus syriacus]|uniref:CCHC-type integrase n=1 Tax=Hibiscus syriacus TaxID=106335 RepID=A0A6A3BPK3_HIBSY|nr:CCHC-type integrase [Hibiscus syriacus]
MKMGVFSNKISREELKPGDTFTPGDTPTSMRIMGFISARGSSLPSETRNCPNCGGDQSIRRGVISSCLDCFLTDGDLYLFKYAVSPASFVTKLRGGTCTIASSDVLHRAFFLLQNGFGVYHLFKNNCEDFAIYCKTGLLVITSISVGRSGQAASFQAAANFIVSSSIRYMTTSFPGLAAVGYGMYCYSRLVSDIGVRRDVEKVPVERLVSP